MSDQAKSLTVPVDIPPDKPNVARMYDCYLGGHHNFAVDRQAGQAIERLYPDVGLVAQANRAFLRRVIRFLVARGVTQFLDIGSGIPTVGNVHEVAQAADPVARVAYVDIDPVAVARSRAILGDDPHATAIQGNARQPEMILAHAAVRGLLDFDQPVAVLLITFLHFFTADPEARRMVHSFVDALVPGGYVAIVHGTFEGAPPDVIAQVERLYAGRSGVLADDRVEAALTARERQLLRLLVRGWDVTRIADAVGISEQTARTYLSRLCGKLGVHSRAEATAWMHRHGLDVD